MAGGNDVDDIMRQTLPRLCWAAFAGDAHGVLECLRDGDDIHENVRLVNQNGQDVLGATPLYLAAQMGHYDVCKVLLSAGADVLRPCVVPATGQEFFPPDIAIMHFHLRTWWILKEARQRVLGKPSGRVKGVFRIGSLGRGKSKPGKFAYPYGDKAALGVEKLIPAGSTPSAFFMTTDQAMLI